MKSEHLMKDFFISYTASDRHWAEWIAWQLEQAGYSTLIQVWDFNPGTNFILQMHNASVVAEKTIAVLSAQYLEKAFPASEWASAFASDPHGAQHTLIPVRVENISPDGLLSALVYIDLFNYSNEKSATKVLLDGVSGKRKKPSKAPKYPVEQCFSPTANTGEPKLTKSGVKDQNSKFEIEIRIRQDFDSFTDTEKDNFLMAVSELLDIHYDLKITKITPGSVVLRIEMEKPDALKLCALFKRGGLKERKISKVWIVNPDPVVADNKPSGSPSGNDDKGSIIAII
jgi:hypothetical protein